MVGPRGGSSMRHRDMYWLGLKGAGTISIWWMATRRNDGLFFICFSFLLYLSERHDRRRRPLPSAVSQMILGTSGRILLFSLRKLCHDHDATEGRGRARGARGLKGFLSPHRRCRGYPVCLSPCHACQPVNPVRLSGNSLPALALLDCWATHLAAN